MKQSIKQVTYSVAIFLILLVAGSCEDPTPAQPVTSIEMLRHAGNLQIANANASLPLPLVVSVRDQNGKPVSGVTVNWSSTGKPNAATSTTDAAGLASVQLILAPYAGAQLTRATVPEFNVFADFTSIALIQGATQMEFQPGVHGNFQTDSVHATLSKPFEVLVRDHAGAAVAGVVVQWTIVGLNEPSGSTVTNQNGIAAYSHKLGSIPGIQRVEAAVAGLNGSPVTFSATITGGRPVELIKVLGDGQWGKAGREIAPYFVLARDARQNPVMNVTVNWTITSGAGSVVNAQSTTSNAGAASTVHVLGSSIGAQTVSASLPVHPAVAPVIFIANAAQEVVHVTSDYYYGEVGYFVPASVTVTAGARVVWAWCQECQSPNTHSVTFEDNPDPPVSSPTMAGGTHARTFTTPGTYRYRCLIHSTSFSDGMVGQVIVQ
jgi:plastocyanin